jgi:hypothetical protein
MFPFRPRPVLAGFVALATVCAAATMPSRAAEQPTTRLHATVRSLDGDTLVLDVPDGSRVQATLAPDARVTGVRRASFADIREGSFVGAAALPGADGHLRALEVHIFPESMRGAGEGHRPMDQSAHKTMTNGTVGVVSASGGNAISIAYGGGEQQLVVPPETPVVALEPADARLVAPGAKNSATVRQDSAGGIIAERVLVGLDGLDPPL